MKPGSVRFSEDIIKRVEEGLAKGTPLAVICREEGMPHYYTVLMWQRNNPDVAERIREAREYGYDAIAYRLREVARGKGESSGDVVRDKLIVWTDLQLLSKWDNKRYGEKIEHSGSIATPPPDLAAMTEQLVTQVSMNKTLKPVLETWARELLGRLEKVE